MPPRVGLTLLLVLLALQVRCSSGAVTSQAGGASGADANAPAGNVADPNDGTSDTPAPTPSNPTGNPVAPTVPGVATPADANFFFGPYKDVTVNANWNSGEISTKVTGALTPVLRANPSIKMVTWAFATGECGAETWGGLSPNQLIAANVADWAAAGTRYMLATGGANGAFTCATDAGFSTFLDRYASSSLAGVDFDIEAGQSAATVQALVARVKAAEANPKYQNLRFSFTIATLGGSGPQNLGAQGQVVVQAILAANLQHYTVNLMAMDYGSPSSSICAVGADGSCDMAQSAINAVTSLHDTSQVPYAHIEVTPMVGGNDVQGEVFTLQDAATVAAFATKQKLAGLHYWSLDRDVDCDQTYASPTCNSYGKAGPFGFFTAFAQGL